MEKVLVKLENVSKKYDKSNVIKKINLDIYEGEFLTLLGPSGCGKTTILRMIAGLETVSDGKVYIDDIDVTNMDPTQREVNTVFQNFALFPRMTVIENISFGLKMKKIDEKTIKTRVTNAINLVKLNGLQDRYPRDLSGGQQQRVAIARAIVNSPKVLLLDESLCSLDLKLKRKMQIELKKIQKKLGITFVYVTHDQNEAITMSDRIAIINNGNIEQLGTPQEIYSKPNNIFIADFIGESNIIDAKIDCNNEDSTSINVIESNIKLIANKCDNVKKNDLVKIIIRPENVKISKNSLTDSYEGIIDDVIYMGDYSKLYIKIDNLILKADENNYDLYKIGDKVYIKFDKNTIIVLKD